MSLNPKQFKKVLIIDFVHSGHHLSYMKLYEKVFEAQGKVVHCAFPLNDGFKNFESLSAELKINSSTKSDQKACLREIRRLVGAVDPDFVFFPYMTYPCFTQGSHRSLARAIGRPWAGIAMHPILCNRTRSFRQKVLAKVFGLQQIAEKFLHCNNLSWVGFLGEGESEVYREFFETYVFVKLPDVAQIESL